jgi:hypothetical protein
MGGLFDRYGRLRTDPSVRHPGYDASMPSSALLRGAAGSGARPRNFRQVLNFAHLALLPRTYVEIGIREGASLSLVLPRTRPVGIDPKPKIRSRTGVPGSAMLFRETSDAFFGSHDLTEVLGGRSVDLAFVDGMHLFEFALRDFINLERHCTADSTATAARRKRTRRWSGDVWKLIVILKAHRPDLDVSVVDVRPTGLGVVRGLDPSDRTLSERYDEICREFMPLPYDHLADGKAEKLNRVPGEWAAISSLFPPRPHRRGSRLVLRSGRLARRSWAKRRATLRRRSKRRVRA